MQVNEGAMKRRGNTAAALATPFAANSSAWVEESPHESKPAVIAPWPFVARTSTSFDFRHDYLPFQRLRALHVYDTNVNDLSKHSINFNSVRPINDEDDLEPTTL
ncbi:hypothetical protein H257_17141 [Aphanomyces astaci]|uniref:Uncharacterized protein n=1 Tax=Aphanomyces astaci TaxID=112090 RepID=W4FFX5_APHAT|nr:hypothetical protein H257_17141 [Aphanomyces astaci]ETV66345.1 hypothetical protein H257_17141 [Aphanomyces astaci]|eukprot:XP_009844120.1 hypothetical protein H257_17141 [Aphanomyces astaci]